MVSDMSDPTVIFHCRPCSVCGNSSEIQVVESDLKRWQGGEHVQNVFPWMSADDRELLISGTHPACWDDMWREDEYGQHQEG